MPLRMSENTATAVALEHVRRNNGSVEGVQSVVRRLGAHGEQARRLTERAKEMYDTIAEVGGWDATEGSSNTVQSTIEIEGKELNVTLKADRVPITTFEELVDFYDIDTEVWHPQSQTFNFWGSQSNPNFQVKARFIKDEYISARAEDREALRRLMSQEAPEWDLTDVRLEHSSDIMMELVISDLHVEKYDGTESSLMRMLKELEEGCSTLLLRALKQYQRVAEIHIVLNGDTFNADNARGTTTKGTPQENVSDWRQVFTQTRETLAGIAHFASTLLQSQVTIHVLAGNHDRERSYYLADSLWAYFSRHPNVEVALTDGLREYVRWGSTLIGLAHGNDVKTIDLVMSMFREQDTSGVRFPVWHLGHYHTRREDELHGVLVRGFRTAQAPGEWEKSKAYGHNQRDIVAIFHHRTWGDIAEYRYSFGADGDDI